MLSPPVPVPPWAAEDIPKLDPLDPIAHGFRAPPTQNRRLGVRSWPVLQQPLTPHQPITYLERLPKGRDGILLFVAPGIRLEVLWRELEIACSDAGKPIREAGTAKSSFFSAQTSDGHTPALTSWRSLLDFLLQCAVDEHADQVASDIRQLTGLCDRMDDEGFIPLGREDLSNGHAVRICHFCHLVEKATDRLASKERLLSVKGFKIAGSKGFYGYGSYLNFRGWFGRLAFDARAWRKWGFSPVWLQLTASEWKKTAGLRKAMKKASLDTDLRVQERERLSSLPQLERPDESLPPRGPERACQESMHREANRYPMLKAPSWYDWPGWKSQ